MHDVPDTEVVPGQCDCDRLLLAFLQKDICESSQHRRGLPGRRWVVNIELRDLGKSNQQVSQHGLGPAHNARRAEKTHLATIDFSGILHVE